jgi:hypothetical protein
MYLYQKCSLKANIWNKNFKVINQHNNNMCRGESLEKDFYLGALAPLIVF